MKGVRLSKEDLKGRLGLSERLAIRVGALQSRGLEFTLVVLEEAGRKPELQDLLLSPALMEKAAALSTEDLRSISPAAGELVVLPASEGEGRVVALEEERLAEEAWQGTDTQEKESGKAPMLPAIAREGTPALDEDEARRLFRPEEVSRLKLVLLTGVDPGEKVEALRRLAFAPLSLEEKGMLTLQCLGDADAQVRREAARALQALGLSRDLSEALAGFATGTGRQRALALEKVGGLAGRLEEGERRVAVSSLVAGLRHESDGLVLQSTIRALRPYADLLRDNAESMALLSRHLARVLVEHYEKVSSHVRSLYDSVSKDAGQEVAGAVWNEVESIGDRRLRYFFLTQICSMGPEGDLRREVADTLAVDFARPGLEDMEFRNAMAASKLLGDEMVDALLRAMESEGAEWQSLVVTILDEVACAEGTSAEARNRAAEKLLELVKTGDRSLRASILEAGTWFDESVRKATRDAFAEELITSLHSYRAMRFQDLTRSAIRRLELDAIGPLIRSVEESPYEIERETAVALLADIAAEHSDSAATHGKLLEFLRGLEGGEKVPTGLAVRSVGRACQSGKADPESVHGIHAEYLKRMSLSSAGFDYLVALADLSASPACEPGISADTALRIVDFLGQSFPDPKVEESQTSEGTLLVLGGQTAVYTELIPDLLQGLLRIAATGNLPGRILERMVDRMIDRFRSVTDYREIWAPGNVIRLAETLESLVRHLEQGLAPRFRVLDAMMPTCGNLSIARATARLFDLEEEESPGYLERVEKFVAQLFSMLERPSYQEAQDQLAILECLGRTAVNRRLAAEERRSSALRERIVEILTEQRVFDTREGRAVLELLRRAKNVPERLRERLKARKGRRRR